MTNIDDKNQQMTLEDIAKTALDSNPLSDDEIEQIIVDEIFSKAASEGFEKMRAGRPLAGGGWVVLTFILAYLDKFLRENGYGSCATIYTYDYDIEAQVKALADKDITDGIVAPVKVEPQYSNSFAEEMTRLWAWLVRSKVWRDYDEENLRILEDRAVDNRISMPFARDKLIGARNSTDRLTASFPQPGQLPQDHIPIEMQATRDKNLEVHNAASYREGVTQEPGRVRQTRGGSKGPDITRFKSDFIQNDIAAPTSQPARTLPLDIEFINPTEYLRNLRNSPPLQFTPQEPRSGVSPAIMAAMLMAPPMPASALPAAQASPQNIQVTIDNVSTPPTRLADADFKRCMQREINQIVTTFDTGMRG